MVKKKPAKNININIGGDAQGTTIIVGDSNVVGQGTQKPADIKSRFLVPFPHNPDFVGRDTELASLHEMLQKKESIVGIRPTVLVGLGGIGKTQLAVEYAHMHRDDYPSGVFWLNAINPLLVEFSDLAEKLEMSDRDTPRDKAARKAWDYLDSHPDALVIFDNVLEPSQLNVPFSPDLVPANLRCRTLFTTRQRDFPRTFQPFEVKVLPEMAAMKLLLRSRPEVLIEQHPEWGWARIVCAYLGWLPLALELAAAYLGTYPEVSITGYLERLRTEGSLETIDESQVRAVDMPTRMEEILKAAAAGNLELKHQVAVSATLQTQWNRLDDEDAKLLFRAAGQFPEATWIQIQRLGFLSGNESESSLGHASMLSRALKKLHDVSLIEELTNKQLRLHPLVQEFASGLSSESFRFELAQKIHTSVSDLIRLRDRLMEFGVDMLLEDVRAGLGFCINYRETEVYTRLATVERFLDHQIHNLRGRNIIEQPSLLFELVVNDPIVRKDTDWQSQSRKELIRANKPYLRERFPYYPSLAELRTLINGSHYELKGIALSANGKRAISVSVKYREASDGYTLTVWDVLTGRELREFKQPSETSVRAVTISSDGMLACHVVIDYYDKVSRLVVWDTETGQTLRSLPGYGIVLGANGKLALSRLGDTVKVWDVETGIELCTLVEINHKVRKKVLSEDGEWAITVSDDQTFKVWNVTTGHLLYTFEEHRGLAEIISVNGFAKKAISLSSEGLLKVWDIDTGNELYTIEGKWAKISGDGKRIVSAIGNTVKIWDIATGRELCTLSGHDESLLDVAVSADGNLIVSISKKTCKVWNISNALEENMLEMQMVSNFEGYSDPISNVKLTANGRLAVSVSDNTLKVWDVRSGSELNVINTGHIDIVDIALSTDGGLAVSASSDDTFKVWNTLTGRQLKELRTVADFEERKWGWSSVALSINRRQIISMSNHVVTMWKIKTGRQIQQLFLDHEHNIVLGTPGNRPRRIHTKRNCYDEVGFVAMSANGRLAISASGKAFSICNVWNGSELWSGDILDVTSVVLSEDGRLVIGASNHSIILWEAWTGRRVLASDKQRERWGLALSADNRLAVCATSNHIIELWDIKLGRCISILQFDAPLNCCAISKNGKSIVVGDSHGGIHFVDVVGLDGFETGLARLIIRFKRFLGLLS